MSLNRLLLLGIWLLVTVSCGTRLKMDVQQAGEIPLSTDAYVLVLEKNGATTPPSKVIASLEIGPSKKGCDYLSVISEAKQTARQLGGNFLWLTRQEEAKNGCLYLEAQVFQVPDLAPWTGKIYWDRKRPLKPDDFWADPPLSFTANALTYSGFFVELEKDLSSDLPRLLTYTFFDPAKSWMLAEDRSNKALLAHEQVHFDLSEWVRRDLQKALNRLNPRREDFMDQINITFDQHLLRLDSLQKAYDQETRHGLDPVEQAKWAQKVAKALEYE
ncbi:MAG: DUF922 domain-containing protein [Bacteroidota bacterium]